MPCAIARAFGTHGFQQHTLPVQRQWLIANDVALRGMELFAAEVLPALDRQASSPSPFENAGNEPALQGVNS